MEKVHPVIPEETWSPLLIIHIRQEPLAIASRAERIIFKKTTSPSREALQVSALNKQVIP